MKRNTKSTLANGKIRGTTTAEELVIALEISIQELKNDEFWEKGKKLLEKTCKYEK